MLERLPWDWIRKQKSGEIGGKEGVKDIPGRGKLFDRPGALLNFATASQLDPEQDGFLDFWKVGEISEDHPGIGADTGIPPLK